MAHLGALPTAEFRAQLETARLDLLALFRALDQLDLTAQEIPQGLLRSLMERDADLAEALFVLGQPQGGFDLKALVRDTRKSLKEISVLHPQFLQRLPPRAQQPLALHLQRVRSALTLQDAYNSIPGGSPQSL